MSDDRDRKRDWLARKCGWKKEYAYWLTLRATFGAEEHPFANSDILVAECAPLMWAAGKAWDIGIASIRKELGAYCWDETTGMGPFCADTLNDALVDMFFDALGGPKEANGD